MGRHRMSGKPKAHVTATIDSEVADAMYKLADASRKSVSEIMTQLLRERLAQMVKEREAQALKEAFEMEKETPVGKLKLWVAERNRQGIFTTPEELAAKKAELEVSG